MDRRYSPKSPRGRARRLWDRLRRPGQWSGAWAVVWLGGGSIGSAIDEALGQHHHVTTVHGVAATFFVGVLGGCAWQWLNRRDLVDRFVPLALFALVAALLALLSTSVDGVDGPGVSMLLGLVSGNVLLEWWLRLPAQRERFEDSLPVPMRGGTRVP